MTVVHRSSIVEYNTTQMFALVDDIPAYPEFLPWCKHSKILQRSDTLVTARIEISRGPLRHTFTTKNTLQPGVQINMEMIEGPFKYLNGKWNFQSLGGVGCKVSLDLAFEFSHYLTGKIIGPIFENIANAMVDAFCKRAKQIYG
jgi:ribosome-associated toxin RatA of RatAB toxin-antitoxin module